MSHFLRKPLVSMGQKCFVREEIENTDDVRAESGFDPSGTEIDDTAHGSNVFENGGDDRVGVISFLWHVNIPPGLLDEPRGQTDKIVELFTRICGAHEI